MLNSYHLQNNPEILKRQLMQFNVPIIFIRHGATDWSKELLAEGPQDLPLNNEVIKNTEQMNNKFRDLLATCDILYTSPMKRALDTANIYATGTDLKIMTIPEIREKYFGDYRLLTPEQIKNNETPIDKESDIEFSTRIIAGIFSIVQKHMSKNPIVIVAHSKGFQFLSKLLADQEIKLNFSEIGIFEPSRTQFILHKYGLQDFAPKEIFPKNLLFRR